jgi:hypothetical protein
MTPHPQAAAIAAAVAGRDPIRLAAAVTGTVRLRALLPGGPIEEHGRDAVVARFSRWFAGLDTVEVVESAGQTVADRLLIHYRLDLARRGTRWACTQTYVCKTVNGQLATIDLLCSGFREIGGVTGDAHTGTRGLAEHPAQRHVPAADVTVAADEPHLANILLLVRSLVTRIQAGHRVVLVDVELTPCRRLEPRASFVEGERMTHMRDVGVVTKVRQDHRSRLETFTSA